MKRTTFTSLFLLIAIKLSSQNYYNISFEGTGINENDPRHEIYIDTITNPANIWQVGKPSKGIFTNAFTLPKAIVTDTLNYYPINDTSSFIIKHIADFGFSMPNEVNFGGKYFVNSDSLTDYGLIEFSPNNGNTWINLNDPQYSGNVFWGNNQPTFTGNSTNWKDFNVSFPNLGSLFNIHNGDTVLIRISFISDGIQTNKDGLMFDSLYVFDVPPLSVGSINLSETKVIAYPNPTSSKFNIELEKNNQEILEIVLCDIFNNNIEEIIVPVDQNHITINVNNYMNGIYFFKIINQSGDIKKMGKFIVNK